MFAISNLTTTEIFRCIPWEFTGNAEVPAAAIKDKAFRTAWMQNPTTKYEAYSLFEGVNPGSRVKSSSSTEEGNDPREMYGLVADYDFKLGDAEIQAGLTRMPIMPNWHETSLSSNARMLWLFEKPILLHSYSFAVFFLQHIHELLPVKQLAGLDEGALHAPDRYYTNGGIWKHIQPTPVPHAQLMGFLVKIAKKYDWRGPENGPIVPTDAIAPELHKKYPRFSEWPGKFEVGGQGPSFWIEGSESPKSALVQETGIYTFAEHATKSFYSWSELTDAKFVSAFKQKQMGEAVADIYYDEKNYYSKLRDGSWAIDNKDNLALYLKTHKGLSDRARKGENASEVDEAIAFVHRSNRVRTATSFAFYPLGLNIFNGERVLNTHTRKTISPAGHPCAWGEGFPWLAKWLENFFDPPEQLPYFLSWFAHYYKSCYTRTPRSGHALFIAGGTGVGKTFLNRAVIGRLMGGFAECNEFMSGSDAFNAELFDVAHWVLDDGSLSSDAKSHKRYTEMVKRCIANPSFRINGKFLKAVTVKWQGRVVITLNTDAESLGAMPNLDLSLREKIMIFKTVLEAKVPFLPPDQMEDILVRELPCLGRYLLDYEYPAHTLGNDPRFFVAHYHEKSLVCNADQSSASGAFGEVLSEYLSEYFVQNPDVDEWRGTSLRMLKLLTADPSMAVAIRRYDAQMIGRQLTTLSNKTLFDIRIESEDGNRIFVISRGTRFPKKNTPAPIPQAVNSKFEKQ